VEKLEIAREQGAAAKATILKLRGPFTISTLFGFEDSLRQVGSVDTVIDISEVPFLDSAALGAVLSHWAYAQRAGHKFAVAGASPRIEELLELTKMTSILSTFRTAEQADRSFAAEAPKV
jgi:anti-sigma B factor antagonist